MSFSQLTWQLQAQKIDKTLSHLLVPPVHHRDLKSYIYYLQVQRGELCTWKAASDPAVQPTLSSQFLSSSRSSAVCSDGTACSLPIWSSWDELARLLTSSSPTATSGGRQAHHNSTTSSLGHVSRRCPAWISKSGWECLQLLRTIESEISQHQERTRAWSNKTSETSYLWRIEHEWSNKCRCLWLQVNHMASTSRQPRTMGFTRWTFLRTGASNSLGIIKSVEHQCVQLRILCSMADFVSTIQRMLYDVVCTSTGKWRGGEVQAGSKQVQ